MILNTPSGTFEIPWQTGNWILHSVFRHTVNGEEKTVFVYDVDPKAILRYAPRPKPAVQPETAGTDQGPRDTRRVR